MRAKAILMSCCLLLFAVPACAGEHPGEDAKKKEHAGEEVQDATDEHAGEEVKKDEKEHAGEEVKKEGEEEHAGEEVESKEGEHEEHAGDEVKSKKKGDEQAGLPTNKRNAAARNAGDFSSGAIKTAITQYIDQKMAGDNGVFKIYDPKIEYAPLSLEFVKIHDPVRKISAGEYFACSDFAVRGNSSRLYDLDFWLTTVGGKLMVSQTQIHKEPTKQVNKWVKTERYTFVNNQPTVMVQ